MTVWEQCFAYEVLAVIEDEEECGGYFQGFMTPKGYVSLGGQVYPWAYPQRWTLTNYGVRHDGTRYEP